MTPLQRGASSGETRLALVIGGLLAAVLCAFKLMYYRNLSYTGDLFLGTQLATSWLQGDFLVDHCFGRHLSIHTYLLFPLLAVFALPLGPAGLLVAMSVGYGASFVAGVRILRLFQVPACAAFLGAAALSLMPLSLHVYQDVVFGFHLETLIPSLGLWLAYFLLRRSWPGAMALTVALLSLKEETPLVIGAIAAAVVAEDLLRAVRIGSGNGRRKAPAAFDPVSLRSPESSGSDRRVLGALNWPALITGFAAVVALPFLLHVIQAHPANGYSPGSFERIRPVGVGAIRSAESLVEYFSHHIRGWLRSIQVSDWLTLAFAGTFGLIVLRPHLLLLGLVTSLVSWLLQDDLLWAPRLAPSFTFYEVAALLGMAAAWRAVGEGRALTRLWSGGVVAGATWLVIVVLSVACQFFRCPRTAELYRVHPRYEIDAANRDQATDLFAFYVANHRSGEPTAASPFLFRYVPYRDLYWLDRLGGQPRPLWILLDRQQGPAWSPDARYRLIGQTERFALYCAVDRPG